MTSPESTTTPVQPEAAPVQKTAEELKIEADAEAQKRAEQEANKPSPAADAAEATANAREEKKSDSDLVLEWLIGNGGISTGDEFYGKFEKVLTQRHEQDTEALSQAAELLKALPELFKQVDFKIEELAKDETRYKNVRQKRMEIIKGICEPILDGHLTAKDVVALVSGIEIASKNDPAKKADYERMGLASGYEGVMCFDAVANKIYIFEDTLVDDFKDEDGDSMTLEIRHMITHEISHSIVESSVKINKILMTKADEIIAAAKEEGSVFAESQSQHIRNTLNGIINVDRDFQKYFDANFTNSDAFKALPDQQTKDAFEAAKKAEFVENRKAQAAIEIITEYTAMYLESDGSFDDFVLNCVKNIDKTKIEQYFGGEFKAEDLKQINEEKDPIKKATLIEELKTQSPKFAKLVEIYQVFFADVRTEMQAGKNNFANLVKKEDDELDEYSSAFSESSAGFGKDSGANTGGDVSLWKEFYALMAAMAGEISGDKTTA